MLQKEGYTVTENKVALTDEVLSNVKVLVLTHARTALTADENAAVAKFVKNGGSLLMAGKSNNSTNPTINNGLLTDIGSAIRMGNDGVFDDSKSRKLLERSKGKPLCSQSPSRISFQLYYGPRIVCRLL